MLRMLLLPVLDLLQAGFVFGFQPLFRRAVIFPTKQGVRQALHIGQLIRGIMGVLIAFSIVQFLHQAGRRIADDQGNRLCQLGQGILFGGFIGCISGVGFGCQGEIHNCLGQVDRTFRHADEMTGLIGGNSKFQCFGIGKAHILTGKPGYPAGNI